MRRSSRLRVDEGVEVSGRGRKLTPFSVKNEMRQKLAGMKYNPVRASSNYQVFVGGSLLAPSRKSPRE